MAQAATPDRADHCIVGDQAIGCRNERTLIELTTRRRDTGSLRDLVQDALASGQCRLFDYGERVQVTSTHGNERSQVRLPGDRMSYWIASSWSRPASECADTPTAAALHRKLGLPDEPMPRDDEDGRSPAFADERAPPRQRWYDNEDDPLRARALADERPSPQRRRYDDEDDRDGLARNDDYAPEDRYSYDDRYARNDGYPTDHRYARNDEYPADDRYTREDDPADDYPGDDGHARDDDYDYRGERFTRRYSRRPPPGPSRPLPSSRYAHHCDDESAMTEADLAACSN